SRVYFRAYCYWMPFALNVCPDLVGFHRIVPCGISDKSVGSLAEFIPGITIDEVLPQVAAAFTKVFGVELICYSS
ncbi:MAG: hypothetical protein F6K13_33080, partial [Okeania sp. SIO2B9]|nr:hypothetical protein [Okeania sp. SIO2B9]